MRPGDLGVEIVDEITTQTVVRSQPDLPVLVLVNGIGNSSRQIDFAVVDVVRAVLGIEKSINKVVFRGDPDGVGGGDVEEGWVGRL